MHLLPIFLLLAWMALTNAQASKDSTEGNASKSSTGLATGSKPIIGRASQATASKSASSGPTTDGQSVRYANYILVALAAVVIILLIYRIAVSITHYIRTLVCMNNDKQRFFMRPNPYVASFKRHVLYAPLFGTRHKQGFRPLPQVNMGIIPNRLQAMFIGGVLAMNVTLTVIGVDWRGEQSAVLHELMMRSGTLAVINLIPMVILSGRNNPLMPLLGIQYDTFNMMHRWFGRILILEALTHVVAWIISTVNKKGWTGVSKSIQSTPYITSGFIASITLVIILFQTPSPIRRAFYETFLHLHIALIVLTLIFLWRHLSSVAQRRYLGAAILIWIVELSLRFSGVIYRSFGRTRTLATVEPLPGDAVRLTLHLPRPFTFTPGQHMYIMIPSLGLWTSHPFSIAWSEASPSPSNLFSEKTLPTSTADLTLSSPTHETRTISAVIRARTGFTSRLHSHALSTTTSTPLTALISAPHGAPPPLDSYGTILLFAAGVGITHQVPRLRHLVQSYPTHTTAVRKVVLVWIIQSPEHLEWIRPWMTTILGLPGRRDVLRVLLFVTRPRSTKEIQSPSQTVQMFPGRPNIATIVDQEVRSAVGAVAVSVCGTGSLSDDVRRVVRGYCGPEGREVDFLEACYGW